MSEVIVSSAEEMMKLGASAAVKAKTGDVFGLIGTLGTGKTHWTKGFVGKIDPDSPVSSPTFSIVNEYPGSSKTGFHFDFYRLGSEDELLALGWDEYLDEHAIVICEWADLFPNLMPANTIWLQISHLPDGSRKVEEIKRSSLELNQ
jgi:tRNA threonylcarbamoyladenosine biosynthesis protein TsaE